jgi:hypothetical protein
MQRSCFYSIFATLLSMIAIGDATAQQATPQAAQQARRPVDHAAGAGGYEPTRGSAGRARAAAAARRAHVEQALLDR